MKPQRYFSDGAPRRIRYLSHTLTDGKKVFRFKYADQEQAKRDLRDLGPEQLPYRLLHSDEYNDPETAEVALAWARRRLRKFGFIYMAASFFSGLVAEHDPGTHKHDVLVDWPEWYDRSAELELAIASKTYKPWLVVVPGNSYSRRQVTHKRRGAAEQYFTADEYAYLRVALPDLYGIKEDDSERMKASNGRTRASDNG